MSLLIAFDDIDQRGNNFIFDYLSKEFSTKLIDNDKLEESIKSNKDSKCLFTTCPIIAQKTGNLITTILYINENNDSYSSRGDNISEWRKNLATFCDVDTIFVTCSTLATNFLNTYRIPCKVQYPYVPNKEKSNPLTIFYNKQPKYMDAMVNFSSNCNFSLLNNYEDFKDAKLYIHIPEWGEQWNINILLAHSYGVPCITYQQGCFSEFCTNGDKLIPVGANEKLWMNNYKIALRDYSINSKIVYDMSQRFHVMNEINQRIKKALKDNGMKQGMPTFAEVQQRASNVSGLKKLQTRKPMQVQRPVSTFVQKIVRPVSRNNDYYVVNAFLESNPSVYAGVGGLGDALITIAAAYNDKGSKVVFGSNSGVRDTVKELFDIFNIESQVVQNFNGRSEGYKAWQDMISHPNCKGSVHIPEDLNYGLWGSNTRKYLDQIPRNMPFLQTIGRLVNPRATKKVIGLCPRGSDHSSTWKQRYLSRDEFQQIVKKYLQENATVLVFGSSEDLSYYNIYQDNNVIFMNSKFAVSHPAPKYPITMRHMLSAVNTCDEIISVDTWLKTYAVLAGIPCKVIMNRYFGKSTMEYSDPSDKIFLDPDFWGFSIVPIEDLI